MVRRVVGLVATIVCGGCLAAPPYPCTEDAQCQRDGLRGRCDLEAQRCDYDGVDSDSSDDVGTVGTDGGCIASMAAGAHSTCVVTEAGALRCWGNNDFGGIDPTVTADAVAEPVDPLGRPVDQISMAKRACALVDDGGLWCWGDGEGVKGGGPPQSCGQGQELVTVGEGVLCTADDGVIDCIEADEPLLSSHEVPEGSVAALQLGQSHACALVDGRVYCWGSPADGRLGADLPDSDPATVMVPLTDVEALAVSRSTSCALTGDQVWCWGANDCGELGAGDSPSPDQPVLVSLEGQQVIDLVAGRNHYCALTSDSQVWCWGSDARGQVSGANRADDDCTKTPPTRVDVADEVIAEPGTLVADSEHSCARLTTGQIVCWGDNRCGQLEPGQACATSMCSCPSVGSRTWQPDPLCE